MDSHRNIFEPGKIWPDTDKIHINAHGGGILFHEGIYYWFGEFKTEGEAGNLAQVGVSCYSSPDLYQWRNHGIALAVSDDPQSEIARGCILERPKVIYNARTNQFVMWFHLEFKGQGYRTARSGVAVSDRVTGPYRFIRSIRPNAGVWPKNVSLESKKSLAAEQLAAIIKLDLQGGPVSGYPTDHLYRRDFADGQMARDTTLFVDDDEIAYHIYASEENGTLHISRLSDDYLSPAGQYVRIFPGRFNEAPAIFKHNGKYWLITSGCTGWLPNAARLSVADSIWGAWTELGNPCKGPNAELTFHGQSTFVLPVAGQSNAFVFMADRWTPDNAIDGRYLWLPILFRDGLPTIRWMDQWDLNSAATPASPVPPLIA